MKFSNKVLSSIAIVVYLIGLLWAGKSKEEAVYLGSIFFFVSMMIDIFLEELKEIFKKD